MKTYASSDLKYRLSEQRKGYVRRSSLAYYKTRAARQDRRNAKISLSEELICLA